VKRFDLNEGVPFQPAVKQRDYREKKYMREISDFEEPFILHVY
jgi:hypothetical protein